MRNLQKNLNIIWQPNISKERRWSELRRMLANTEKLVQRAPISYFRPFCCLFLSLNPFLTARRVLSLCFTLLLDFWLATFTRYISAFLHASAVMKPCSAPNFVNTGNSPSTPPLWHMTADGTAVLSTELPT